jgi:glycosyltransferase involved in cell wall biosynthesis
MSDQVGQDIFVAMPTYNRGEKCVKVIKYIMAQSISNWYLYIVDDGSEKEHSDIIVDFVNNLGDDRITYVKNDRNMRVSATLNVAIRAFLEGDWSYFTWVSDDNHYFGNYLKNLYDLKADFAHSAWFLGGILSETEYRTYEDVRRWRGLASYMWSRYAIETIGEYNEKYDMVCDLEYMYRTYLLIENIKYTPWSEMMYVLHPGADSITQKNRVISQHRELNRVFNPDKYRK